MNTQTGELLSPTQLEKSLPCPFCGEMPRLDISFRYPRYGKHAGEQVNGYIVVCDNPSCQIYHADNQYYLSDKKAIRMWNKRKK